jgi:hypothetical protein
MPQDPMWLVILKSFWFLGWTKQCLTWQLFLLQEIRIQVNVIMYISFSGFGDDTQVFQHISSCIFCALVYLYTRAVRIWYLSGNRCWWKFAVHIHQYYPIFFQSLKNCPGVISFISPLPMCVKFSFIGILSNNSWHKKAVVLCSLVQCSSQVKEVQINLQDGEIRAGST